MDTLAEYKSRWEQLNASLAASHAASRGSSPDPQPVTVENRVMDDFEHDERTPAEMHAWVDDVFSTVPEEHRVGAKLRFSAETEFDSPLIVVSVIYTRLETPVEVEYRLKVIEAEAAREMEQKRRQLRALKAELGDG